jgi:hypothetical protein
MFGRSRLVTCTTLDLTATGKLRWSIAAQITTRRLGLPITWFRSFGNSTTFGQMRDRQANAVIIVIDDARGRSDGIFVAPFEQGKIGPDLFDAACRMGLEGLVSKHRERAYRGGRCDHWVKVKNRKHPAFSRDQF